MNEKTKKTKETKELKDAAQFVLEESKSELKNVTSMLGEIFANVEPINCVDDVTTKKLLGDVYGSA